MDEEKDYLKEVDSVFPGMIPGIYNIVDTNKQAINILRKLNGEDNEIAYYAKTQLDNTNDFLMANMVKSYSTLHKAKSKFGEKIDFISGNDFVEGWTSFTEENGLNVREVLSVALKLSGAPVFDFHDKQVKEDMDKGIYEYIKDRIKWSVTTPENKEGSLVAFMFDYKEGSAVLSSSRNEGFLTELSSVFYDEIKKHNDKELQTEIKMTLAKDLLNNNYSYITTPIIAGVFNDEDKKEIVNRFGESHKNHPFVAMEVKGITEDKYGEPTFKQQTRLIGRKP